MNQPRIADSPFHKGMRRALRRLEEERPDLAAKVQDGTLTTTTAMRSAGFWAEPSKPAAGFHKPPTPVEWSPEIEQVQVELIEIEERVDQAQADGDGDKAERLIRLRRQLTSRLEQMKLEIMGSTSLSTGGNTSELPIG